MFKLLSSQAIFQLLIKSYARAELARALDCSYVNVCKLIRGERRVSTQMARRIANLTSSDPIPQIDGSFTFRFPDFEAFKQPQNPSETTHAQQ
jgi:hypothetical protein